MAHHNMARRHSQAWDRRMETGQGKAQHVSVLMGDKDLKRAMKETTEDGRKHVDGIFADNGKRVERPQAKEVFTSRAEQLDHEKMTALAGLTKNYKETKKRDRKLAKKQNMTEHDLADRRAKKKADKALANITEGERLQFEALFKAFDKDGDRNWGSIEFAQGMTDIGIPTSVEASANLLYFAGVKDVDRITYEDFLAIMPKLKAFRTLIEKEVMKHFQFRDKGSGYITTVDLREMLVTIAGREVMDHHHVESIVKRADKRREGQVNFDEVITAMFGSKPQIEYQLPLRHRSMSHKVKSTMLGWLKTLCGSSIEEDLDLYLDDPPDGELGHGHHRPGSEDDGGSIGSGSPLPSPPESPRSDAGRRA